MSGKYLSTNIEPLKAIGDGKVFEAINAIISDRNEYRASEAKGKLIAYKIHDFSGRIVDINFLIEDHNGLSFGKFEYYMRSGNVEDSLMSSTKYSFGIHFSAMEDFFELREFYLENKG
jgi:hypothetical protein